MLKNIFVSYPFKMSKDPVDGKKTRSFLSYFMTLMTFLHCSASAGTCIYCSNEARSLNVFLFTRNT